MAKLKPHPLTIGIAVLVFFGIGVIEDVLKPGGYGSLLLTLVFWTGVVQGCIALVAAAEVCNGKWILSVKPRLLSVYPMLLVLSCVFLFMIPQMDMYGWSAHQGIWLNKKFFIIRNFVFLLLSFIFAGQFARASFNHADNRKIFAVVYLFIFVVSQSLVAFDWVMSLEYPWISTLLGGYFFVESLYAGVAVTGIICFFITKPKNSGTIIHVKQTLRDAATLLFGLSLFWAGLFFAQYLVIWYGNIPEEIGFLYDRLYNGSLRELSIVSVVLLFPVPFISLMFSKTKSNPAWLLILSFLVLIGLLLERLVFLIPSTSINALFAVLEFTGMTYLFILALTRGKSLFPDHQPVIEAAE